MKSKKIGCAVDISKNNCHACTHLDYYQKEGYEDNSPEGYFCNGREYKTDKEEATHLKRLESQIYRARIKNCCEREDLVGSVP